MAGDFWTGLGVLLTLAMVALSAFINYSFGYTLGTTETNARIFGAVSVVAVGVIAVLPLRISAHWFDGRKARAVLGAGVFGILVAYAIAGSIGFGMQNRSQLAGSRENLAAQLDDAVRERDQATARLKSLPEHRPSATVLAVIAAAKKDRRWEGTEGCTNATASSSREYCQTVDRLTGELGTAATAAVLSEKLDKLNFSIENLRRAGAGQIADPQSFGLAAALGITQDAVRVGLSILLAMVVESVCCFGLLVIIGSHLPQVPASETTIAEWIGKWLNDRAEPNPGARVSLSDLQADFLGWAQRSGAPKLTSWKFKRLIRAACREVGLVIEGRMVKGLQLVTMLEHVTDYQRAR